MKTAGISFIILGVLAILFPYFTALSFNFMLAFLIMLGGAGHFWWIWLPSIEGRLQHLLLAALYLTGGAMLIVFPNIGIISFTLLLGAAFIAHGAIQMSFAATASPARAKTMLLISAIVSMIAGGLIIFGLPYSAKWAVGTISGINLAIFGAALLSLERALSSALD